MCKFKFQSRWILNGIETIFFYQISTGVDGGNSHSNFIVFGELKFLPFFVKLVNNPLESLSLSS